MMELKRISSRVLYSGKVFDLVVDEIEYPSGKKGVREVARHPGGAVTVPVLDDGRLLFVKQLRYPFGRHLIEFPAGKLSPGEDPRLAAARELEEETGFVAGSLEHLTSIYTTPGFCNEELHIFLATQLVESVHGHQREEGEFTMTLHRMSLDVALALVEKGEIQDSKTIIGLLWLDRRMRRMQT